MASELIARSRSLFERGLLAVMLALGGVALALSSGDAPVPLYVAGGIAMIRPGGSDRHRPMGSS